MFKFVEGGGGMIEDFGEAAIEFDPVDEAGYENVKHPITHNFFLMAGLVMVEV